MYLLQRFFKKGIKLCRTIILFRGEAEKLESNQKRIPFIRIQEFSVDAIGRCFRDTLETIHRRTKYKLNRLSHYDHHFIKKTSLFS